MTTETVTRSRITALLLFLLAILPRLAALGRYVTPDEPIWVYRSIQFRRALLEFDWAGTIQSGHPGIPTMWLGAAGLQLQLWLQPAAREALAFVDTLYWLAPDNDAGLRALAQLLVGPRLMVILVTSAGVALIYLLARPVLGRGAALAGGLLLALDPFTAGLSGLLHVDALLATFSIVTVLLVLPGRPWTLSAATWAGVATGLALLAKVPGLLLILFVGLAIGLRALGAGRAAAGRGDAWQPAIRPYVTGGAMWLLALLLTTVAVLPALTTTPRMVFEEVFTLSGRLMESAVRPIFYRGEATLIPGLDFYPVATALRLSPLATVGVAAAAIAGWRQRRQWATPRALALGGVLLFTLLFLILLSATAKKYDRYALPALVALLLVAGWGLAQLGTRLRRRGAGVAAAGAVVILQGAFLLASWPYPLTAYNWWLGGPGVADNVLTAGWGEATGAAARAAAARSNAEQPPTLFAGSVASAAPFYPGPVESLRDRPLAYATPNDWVIVTAGDRQLDDTWPPPEDGVTVIETAGTVNGSLYHPGTWLEVKHRRATVENLLYRFGQDLLLVAGGVGPAGWPADIPVELIWQAQQPRFYTLRLRLEDDAGHVLRTVELPLLNTRDQPVPAWPVGQTQRIRAWVPVPSDLPPGTYRVSTVIFDENGARLGVFDSAGRFTGTAAPLGRTEIGLPAGPPAPNIPNPLGGAGPLAGVDELPQRAESGAPLALDVWWRGPIPDGSTLVLGVGPQQVEIPLAPAPWPAEMTFRLRPAWRLPPDVAPGVQPVNVAWRVDGETMVEPVTLGVMEVVQRPRVMALPAGIDPLQLQFGAAILLQQVEVRSGAGGATVNLVWQAREDVVENFTMFVHLRRDGTNVTQQDRPPTDSTGTWVAGEVIADRVALSWSDPGQYTVAVGLYDPDTGVRLPLYAADGTPLGDEYTVEVTIP